MNSLFVIAPYKYEGMWVFDDPAVGLSREPFIAGIDTMVDKIIAGIPNADKGFRAIFSAAHFRLLRKALVPSAVLRQFRAVMADRRLGCLSIFLFVALCASLFVNFVLVVAAFQRIGGVREAEPMPRFREILLQRGTRGTTDK